MAIVEGDFPFFDLTASDFHRLVLFVVQRWRDRFLAVEDFGSGGRDGGRDIVATGPLPDGSSGRTVIQVKRRQRLTESDIAAELDKIAALPSDARPHQYILATAASPPARLRDILHRRCRAIGIRWSETWGRSELTGRLLDHDDIVDFFFGRRSDGARDRRLLARYGDDVLVRGSVLVLGQRCAGIAKQRGARTGENAMVAALKALAEAGLLSGIIDFGDASATSAALAAAGFARAVRWADEAVVETPFAFVPGWRRDGTRHPGMRGDEFVAALRLLQHMTEHPAVLLLDADDQDVVTLGPFLAALAPTTPLYVIGDGIPPVALPPTATILGGSVLNTLGRTVPDRPLSKLRRLGRCQPLDYVGSPSIARLVRSEPFAPADVAIACEPGEDIDGIMAELERTRHCIIEGTPGQGKSALALTVAHRSFLQGSRVFRLECRTLGRSGISIADLYDLMDDLHSPLHHTVVIVDDFHVLGTACADFTRCPFEWNVFVIFTIVSMRMGVPKIRDEVRDVALGLADSRITEEFSETWIRFRESLGRWVVDNRTAVEDVVGIISENTLNELSHTVSPWHFFYILRGGQSAVAEELAQARKAALSHVVWFLVCASRFMDARTCGYFDLLDLCERYDLPVAKCTSGHREAWLTETLDWLANNRMVITERDGYFPRHQLEAAAVMRTVQKEEWECGAILHDVAIAMLTDRLSGAVLDEEAVGVIRDGDKYAVKSFCRGPLAAHIARAAMFDLGLHPSCKLEEAYRKLWAPLVKVMTEADLHHLYWICMYLPILGHGGLLYPPTYFLGKTRAFQLRDGSDVVDFGVVINAIMSREYLNLLDEVYERARYPASVLAFGGELRAWLAVDGVGDLLGDELMGEIDGLVGDEGELRAKTIQAIEDVFDHAGEQRHLLEQTVGATLAELRTGDLADAPVRALSALVAVLDHKRAIGAPLTDSIDMASYARFANQNVGSLPLILFSLWQLSPPAAAGFLATVDPDIREKSIGMIIERIDHDDRSISLFHSGTDRNLTRLFFAWLAGVDDVFAAWLERQCGEDDDLRVFRSHLAAAQGQLAQGGRETLVCLPPEDLV